MRSEWIRERRGSFDLIEIRNQYMVLILSIFFMSVRKFASDILFVLDFDITKGFLKKSLSNIFKFLKISYQYQGIHPLLNL